MPIHTCSVFKLSRHSVPLVMTFQIYPLVFPVSQHSESPQTQNSSHAFSAGRLRIDARET